MLNFVFANLRSKTIIIQVLFFSLSVNMFLKYQPFSESELQNTDRLPFLL